MGGFHELRNSGFAFVGTTFVDGFPFLGKGAFFVDLLLKAGCNPWDFCFAAAPISCPAPNWCALAACGP